jgi:proteasome lid subunit RPN8/RPN11
MEAAVVRLADISRGRTDWLRWPNDHTVSDDSGIEVRFSSLSMTQMRAEARRGRRVRARNIETGGMLLGELDDACRCLWVDTATGPPPDSELSPAFFLHGLIGTEEAIEHHRKLSASTTTYQGMWHIHPDGPAGPSNIDRGAMEVLVDPGRYGVPRALLVILGAPPASWDAWLDEGEPPYIYATVVRRTTNQPSRRSIDPPPSHRPQAWTGGWRTRPTSPRPAPKESRRRRFRRLQLRRRG